MKTTLKLGISVLVIFAAGILISASDVGGNETSQIAEDSSDGFGSKYHIAMPPIPDTVTFCGEIVPKTNWEVRERLERELLSNTYWQSNTMLLLKRSGKYFPMMDRILKEEGVPTDFKYLAVAESGLTNAVSPAGARGVWQFMKSTGQAYDLKVNSEIDERYHIEKATRAACAYLKKAKKSLGSWTLAAAAYNRGLPGIRRDIAKQKVDSYYDLYMNTETSRYVFRIVVYKLIMENPTAYGFNLESQDYYTNVPTINISVDTTIADLADFALDYGTNYKTLKLLNPWLRDNHVIIKPGTKILIEVPK
ncbi:MAG: membrane-bound lytic murein transglycosylase D [Bacteroidia bacterium]|jgi:membrane-bound lytic murein transglycosylase D